MKNFLLALILMLYLPELKAQVMSSHDGFYEADSVFYELSGVDSFKYCVNCYTSDSLKAYHTGVWLYSREHAPNTWENNRFSYKQNLADTTGMRADVVKANTVWVRVFKKGGYADEHHLIYLGKWRPKAAQVVSVLLDSSDFMGPDGFYGPGMGMETVQGYVWNYRLKLEKNCSYEIFSGPRFELEAQQSAGLEMSAQESAEYPDKAIQLNAGNAGVLNLGKSLTDSLGGNIKILRFRLGGTNHRGNIIANEIAAAVIRPDLGGTPSVPVCVFINGSFWTYALAEEGMGVKRISNILNIPTTRLTTAKVPPITTVASLKKNRAPLNALGHSVYSICGVFNYCLVYYIYHDTLQFHIDSADVDKADVFDALCKTVYAGRDSLIASAIERESFYRYALAIWFFQNGDSWGNHLTLVRSDNMPWKIFGEHFDFSADNANASDWDKYFTRYADGHREGLPWRATKKMLSYDKDYFCLVFEDELNTTYKTDRTVPIAQQKIAALRPCISECSQAWWPNDWIDSVKWERAVSKIAPFFEQRPNTLFAALPKIFLSGADTLWQLKDRNDVTIKFDHAPVNSITVKLNSLEIKSDFTGRYYPKPDLRIAVEYDHKKYEFVKWLEYPDKPASFTLSANKPITLTPVLKLKK